MVKNDSQDQDQTQERQPERSGYSVYEFEIPEFRAKETFNRLTALSNKAVALGMPAFDIEVGAPVLRRVRVQGAEMKMAMIPFTVEGGAPMIQGWRFVAKIEHDPMGNEVKGFGVQPLVDANPGLFKTLTTCKPNCQHCNLKRNRNTTFLFQKTNTDAQSPTEPRSVETKQPELMQVGSSCVADFSGHKNPEAVLSHASQFVELLDELRDTDEMASGGSAFRAFETKDVWAAAAALIRVDGRWVSRANATESGSSTDWVLQILADAKTFNQLVEDVDWKVADRVAQWLTSDNFDPGTSVYHHNLSVIAHRRYVTPKAAGFAGSAVAAWGREQMKARQRKSQDKAYESLWLGKHDEKIDRIVTVDKIIPIETMYGTTRLHIFRDTETNAKITWFNSGERKFFAGDTYKISGRVKEMGIRDGHKETQLTRVNSPDIALHKKINDGLDEKALIKKARKLSNINARDGDGESLLHTVSHFYRYRKEGKALILDLIERGADPSMVSNRDGNNAFDYWVDSEDEELIRLGCERFPELAARWDDKMLETYGLGDKPWVPFVKAAREKALQVKAMEQAQVSRSSERKAEPAENGQSALETMRGGAIPEGERLSLEPISKPQTSVDDDDDLHDDETLKLA